MTITTLKTGSSGNAFLLSGKKGKLLLECGINIKQLKTALNYELDDVLGCVITHEHGDHASAAKNVLQEGIPLLASKGTFEMLDLLEEREIHILKAFEPFDIGDFTITPFPVHHDAAEPFGYVVDEISTGDRLCFFTDTYLVNYHFPNVTHFLVEENHDYHTIKKRVEEGSLLNFLGLRVIRNHMSKYGLSTFLKRQDLSKVKEIIKIHQSDNNL